MLATVSRSIATIPTRDGQCEASIFRPDEGEGPWPAVIVYMDALGIRPALFEIGERIASFGYTVLLPDLFYRVGRNLNADPKKLFSDPTFRADWLSKVAGSLTQEKVMSDTASFLEHLASRSDVKPSKVGTTGYCMGGGFALSAAGFFPDRVGAAASFHGGRLATDAPDSPHLQAPKMKARVYVAGAVEDPSFPDDMKKRLEDALVGAGVEHTVITYEGARHGWVPSDTPVHDKAAAERHYEALRELYASTLV